MTDLGFDIHLGGRAAKAIHAEVVRPLTESDLALLATERGIKPTHIQRITNRHHALARCLASGMSATEAGLCTGYTASRISILKDDPSFEELIAFYRTDKALPVQGLNEKLVAIASDSAAVLLDRLELEPEKFSVGELQDQVKIGADRTGFGPKSTQVNVNVNLGDRLRAARERASSSQPNTDGEASGARQARHETSLAPTIIDGTFTEVKND